MKKTIFISYSRQDGAHIYPLVELLRATGAKVFVDVDSIHYGEQWQQVLLDSLQAAGRVLVFWSQNAAQSAYVKQEYLLAIKTGVPLIPVPLDNTPLPHELARFQALRELLPLMVEAEKNKVAQALSSPAKPLYLSWKVWLAAALPAALWFFDPSRFRRSVYVIGLVIMLLIVAAQELLSPAQTDLEQLSQSLDHLLFPDHDADHEHHDHHADHPDHADDD